MKNLHQISEKFPEKRNVTVVFKNSHGQFIAALEVQNIPPPYIDKVKTKKAIWIGFPKSNHNTKTIS